MADFSRPRVDRPLRLLIVDDDDLDRVAARRALAQGGLSVALVEANDLASARAALADGEYDCLLVDYMIPGSDGQQVIDLAASLGVDAPAVVLTGQGDEMLASELLKRGAADYLPKSQIGNGQLARSVVQVIREHDLERRERAAREALSKHVGRLHMLVECSERIHAARTLEEMAAVIAVEALGFFEARAVTVEVLAVGEVPAITRTASAVESEVEAP